MVALLVVTVVVLALLAGLTRLLRFVRSDQDARIAEHWRRNGREWPGKDW